MDAPDYYFCCQQNVALLHSSVQYPGDTFKGSTESGGGCCAANACLEYQYETLGVLPFHSAYPLGPDETADGKASATTHFMPQVPPQGQMIIEGQDIPISESIPGTPAAWRARIGQVAVPSHANEDWDIKAGRQRLHNVDCSLFALLVVTIIMLVL